MLMTELSTGPRSAAVNLFPFPVISDKHKCVHSAGLWILAWSP